MNETFYKYSEKYLANCGISFEGEVNFCDYLSHNIAKQAEILISNINNETFTVKLNKKIQRIVRVPMKIS